jgi:hypothetical protein
MENNPKLPYRDQAKVAFRAAKEESLVRFNREDSDNPDAVAWNDSWYETCCGENWITGYAAALAAEQLQDEPTYAIYTTMFTGGTKGWAYDLGSCGFKTSDRDDALRHADAWLIEEQTHGPITITDEMVDQFFRVFQAHDGLTIVRGYRGYNDSPQYSFKTEDVRKALEAVFDDKS